MILLYSLPNCKWCILAKELLKSNNISFQVKEIDINKKTGF
jgi:glutaredoxin